MKVLICLVGISCTVAFSLLFLEWLLHACWPAMSCNCCLRNVQVLLETTGQAYLHNLPCSGLLKAANCSQLRQTLPDGFLVPADDQHWFPLLGNSQCFGILVHGESSSGFSAWCCCVMSAKEATRSGRFCLLTCWPGKFSRQQQQQQHRLVL